MRRAQAKRKAENKLLDYKPYAKQREFHAAGATHRERLLMAGNRLGKTYAGAAEVAMHVTGLYPDWWVGRRFDRPTRWWVAGVTGVALREAAQANLVGPAEREEAFGTGAIPKATILDWKRSMGAPNLLDSVTMRHRTGGISTIAFKYYSQGREAWQGATLDGIWFDEEPPMDIYMEGLTRTNTVADGLAFLTFTPLMGATSVVKMFLKDAA